MYRIDLRFQILDPRYDRFWTLDLGSHISQAETSMIFLPALNPVTIYPMFDQVNSYLTVLNVST